MSAYLQLRWTENDGKHGYGRNDGWLCHYELVLPLNEHDIRREDEDGNDVRDALVIPIKTPTWRGGGVPPCRDEAFDAPYRDGAHALWDSKKLGDIPIFVISLDGVKASREEAT